MSSKDDNAIPKLVDFGLSQVLRADQKLKDSLGTIGYCAPEIIKGNPYSFEADLWSLGVIFYRIISSNLPFEDENKEL